jgi:hypothetical protein
MSSIDEAQKQAAQAGFYVSARPDGFQVFNKSEDLSPREPYFEAEEDAWDWAARLAEKTRDNVVPFRALRLH